MYKLTNPGVAKLGIALGSGPRDRGFKSRRSDQLAASGMTLAASFFITISNMEDRRMDHTENLLERSGTGASVVGDLEQHSVQSVQNLEAVINEGLRVSLSEETPDDSLRVLLRYLGKALNGERTYIFEQNEDGCDDNTYEWTADGVEPEIDSLQNVPPEVCASWYRNFSIGRHIVIQRLEDIRESDPLQYENLERQGIRSLVVVPLYDGKRIIGFYGVDNPPVKSLEYASNMLQTAAYFIVSSLKRRNLVRELQKRSYLEGRRSLEDILEGARTGIWTIELEDGCPPRMYADRTMRILLGVTDQITPEECYQRWFQNIDPDYVEMVQETVREILGTGRAEVIYPWNHPQLGKIYVRCGGVPDRTFKKSGVSLNGYHQDITETMVTRKKQEQSIMELLERVRQANSAKSEFLSHMSHDLRTPINGILGMLTILEKNPDDPEQQRACRDKIRMSTEHLLSLVNDVLQVSKLESGRPAAAKELFDQEHRRARTDWPDMPAVRSQADSAVQPAPPADGDWAASGNIAGMSVLLVEDNEINCEIMEFILRDAGARVVTAHDGKAAVDAFSAAEPGSFDCVLMDLMMPVMSGYEAARVIRGLGRPDAETVPIIALSANAFEEDVALAKDAGMNEHLAKPVNIGKMFQIMSRLSGRSDI